MTARNPAMALPIVHPGSSAAFAERLSEFRALHHGVAELDRVHRTVAARRDDVRAAGRLHHRPRPVRSQAHSLAAIDDRMAGWRRPVADPGRRRRQSDPILRNLGLSGRSPASCSRAFSAKEIWCGWQILRRAYLLVALIATAAGYIGFFHLLPGADIFLDGVRRQRNIQGSERLRTISDLPPAVAHDRVYDARHQAL